VSSSGHRAAIAAIAAIGKWRNSHDDSLASN
jgi:hypothetical protein